MKIEQPTYRCESRSSCDGEGAHATATPMTVPGRESNPLKRSAAIFAAGTNLRRGCSRIVGRSNSAESKASTAGSICREGLRECRKCAFARTCVPSVCGLIDGKLAGSSAQSDPAIVIVRSATAYNDAFHMALLPRAPANAGPDNSNSGHVQRRSKKDSRMKKNEGRSKADQKRRADFQKQIDADWRRLGLRGHACGEVSGGFGHRGASVGSRTCRLSPP